MGVKGDIIKSLISNKIDEKGESTNEVQSVELPQEVQEVADTTPTQPDNEPTPDITNYLPKDNEFNDSEFNNKKSAINKELIKELAQVKDPRSTDDQEELLKSLLKLMSLKTKTELDINEIDNQLARRKKSWANNQLMDIDLAIRKYNADIDKTEYAEEELDSEQKVADKTLEQGESDAKSFWTGWLLPLISGILPFIDDIFSGLAKLFPKSLEIGFKALKQKLKKSFNKIVLKPIRGIKNFAKTIGSGIKNVLANLWEKFASTKLGEKVVTGAKALKGKVVKLAAKGKDKLLSTKAGGLLKKAGNKIASVGKNIAKKFGKKSASKVAAKAGAKAAGKSAAKAAGKSALKKIPGLGLIAGVGFAIHKVVKEGDWAGAGLELLSGAASMIPGIGTGLSIAIDAASMVRDVKRDIASVPNEQLEPIESQSVYSEPTSVTTSNDSFIQPSTSNGMGSGEDTTNQQKSTNIISSTNNYYNLHNSYNSRTYVKNKDCRISYI